jgi:hypothetical protein
LPTKTNISFVELNGLTPSVVENALRGILQQPQNQQQFNQQQQQQLLLQQQQQQQQGQPQMQPGQTPQPFQVPGVIFDSQSSVPE